MRKELPLILTAAFLVNSCAPAVAKALENQNEGSSPKILTPVPPLTFTPDPTQIPTEPPIVLPTPYLLDIPTQTLEVVKTPDILYFKQTDYPNEKFISDGSTWSYSGCSLMVGAMLDKTNPYIYYNDFVRILKEIPRDDGGIGVDGSEMITANGSDLKYHRFVLEKLGHTFSEPLSVNGNLEEIKSGIKKYTDQGIPVLIRSKLWTGFATFGHYTIAVGINQDGRIIYYDPVYGQNVLIPESAEDAVQMGTTHWELPLEAYAVYPKGQTPQSTP